MRSAARSGILVIGLAGAALSTACAGAGAGRAPESAPQAAASASAAAFTERVANLERRPGLFDLYLDRDAGRLLAALPAPAGDGLVGEYLYVEGLVTGLGSNPIGLDRGQLGETRLVALRRLGGRLLVEALNLGYRAESDDPAERRATRESFAGSVLWAAPIEATAADGRLLVDLTGFAIRDAHGVGARLAEAGEGRFGLDAERSALDFDACLAFPDNVELEALLTWGGEEAGPEVRGTVPVADAFSLVQHHTFLRLPEPGYRPRAFDPRAGSFAIWFQDYAAPLAAPLERRWIVRHRLQGPDAELVYYVDPAIPEPVRGAVLEGAGWWADAFAAAGFPGAYRVELLPEGAHPLDARYNVIQWVHRATRGWSYGGGVVDPRTGEMIKGHVNLGSLRVRQDRLLFEGLVGADASGSGGPNDPVQAALARIRQLAAHEVGHTLGLAHNFAASTYGRASVMDYPAPLVTVGDDGAFDLSQAYGVGVGAWDVHAVRYAYAEFDGPEAERAGLAALVAEGLERGLVMLSDADARPPGAAHRLASLWDNGADPVTQLELDLEVRRLGLERFGAANVRAGAPLALLEETLVPLYFRHRYQLEAAAKLVGGVDYRYAVRGDGQGAVAPVPAAAQRRALAAVLAVLDPALLDLPDGVLGLLAPRPYEYRRHRELFNGWSAPVFDPLAAAATAADQALRLVLQRERAARLVDQHRRDPVSPGLTEVLETVVSTSFARRAEGERLRAIEWTVEAAAAGALVDLAADAGASPAVRAAAEAAVAKLAGRLETSAAGEETADAAHDAALARALRRFLDRRHDGAEAVAAAPGMPPGSPIGADAGLGVADGGLSGCAFAPYLESPDRKE